MKLSMSVDILPCTMDVPVERRGLPEAKISVTEDNASFYITLLSDQDGSFKGQNISAMLRLMAGEIDRRFCQTKEAA